MDNYTKSNEVSVVAYTRLSGKEYRALLLDRGDRKTTGQALLNYLCDKFKISRIPLIVAQRNRQCRGKRQVYGYYRYSNGRGVSITIYNYTAKTGQEVAIKAFANTLLHEFIHHYDTEVLKIQTIHSAGFYKRISDLESKLSK